VNVAGGIALEARLKVKDSWSDWDYLGLGMGSMQSGYNDGSGTPGTLDEVYFAIHVSGAQYPSYAQDVIAYHNMWWDHPVSSAAYMEPNDFGWHRYTIKYDPSTTTASYYKDGVFKVENSSGPRPYDALPVVMCGRDYYNTNYLDFVFVRKYVPATTVNNPPTASFTYSPTSPTTDDTIQFTDQSTDSDDTIASWYWDFGDGTTSAEQNPTHRYSTAGTYTVTLTVTDDDGTTDSTSQTVEVNQPPVASFTYSPSSPTTDDTIQFADASTDGDGTIVSWSWDFGDGTTSTEQNPTHQYLSVGTYEVTLTVMDDCGATSDTSEYVTIDEAPMGLMWHIEIVDQTGLVGLETSIALDSLGYPHISYMEYVNYYGDLDYADRDLKYARWTGDSWNIVTVDSVGCVGGGGTHTSIALDSSDHPHISYLDGHPDYDLEYARWTGDSWSIETVDSTGDVGYNNSIALDSSGYPHISYDARMDTNGGLRYARYTGDSWSIEAVDPPGGGDHSSIVLDSSGYPHISYQGYPDFGLKYARWTGDSWSIEEVDSTVVAGFTSIALDSAGHPHISYWDSTNDDLKYARWTGDSWSIVTVDSEGSVGPCSSIALDSSDYPHISYWDYTNRDLKYARWTGDSWDIVTVDSEGSVGPCSSIALDSSDYPHISYRDETYSDLKYARRIGEAVNTPPTASFTYSPSSPTTDDLIQFTDKSTDSDGSVVSWSWDFGDGTTSTSQNPTHQYFSAGTYTVTLTVTDDGGATGSSSQDIFVGTLNAPQLLEATIDIDPDTLQLGSEGEWVTCYIELPGGNVANIDISSIRLEGTVQVDPDAPTEIGDYDNDGVPDLMVKFDWLSVEDIVALGPTTLTVTGDVDSSTFTGSDTIDVIDTGLDKKNTKILTSLKLPPLNSALCPGESVTFTATLTDEAGNPLPDKTIGWSATSGSFDSPEVMTDSLGEASVTYTAASDTEDSITVAASFAGDAQYESSDVSLVLDIKSYPELSITPFHFSLPLGDSITLTAVLTSNGTPLSGKTITWSTDVGNIAPLSTTTDSEGKASVTYTAPSFEAEGTVTASFAGDEFYYSCTAISNVKVVEPPVKNEDKADISNHDFHVEISERLVKVKTLSGNPGGKVIVVNLDNVFAFENLNQVEVSFDDRIIERADDYKDVRDPTNDVEPEYLILVGEGTATQLLISVPLQDPPPTPTEYTQPLDFTSITISPLSFAIFPGDQITLTATLTSSSGPLENRTITWSTTSGNLSATEGTTDNLGQTTVTFTAPTNRMYASATIIASFAGDEWNEACQAFAIATIKWENITSLTISPTELALRPSESVTFTATLTSYGDPVVGKTIDWVATEGTFSSESEATDNTGKVSVTYTAPDFPTTVTIMASFAGDENYDPSNVTLTFSVKFPTELTVTPSTSTLGGGESITLTATLTSDGAPLVGKTVTWIALSGYVIPFITVTDNAGQASVTYTAPDTETYDWAIASFAGDNSYRSSTGFSGITIDSPLRTVKIVIETEQQYMRVTVDSESPEGQTVSIDLDNSVIQFNSLDELRVLFDNREIQMATDYDDVFDPTDDNDAEYMVSLGGEGTQLLVSIPHFSTHTIIIVCERPISPRPLAPAPPATQPAQLLTQPFAFAVPIWLVIVALITLAIGATTLIWKFLSGKDF
jgi:PKD repeat protein